MISGHYADAPILHGRFIGVLRRDQVHCRYVQGDTAGNIDSGVLYADVTQHGEGHVRLIEHFRWVTREGTGISLFVEARRRLTSDELFAGLSA